MTLLTVGGRRRDVLPPLPPLPYAVPSVAPYNVPQHLITPTYDGSGCTVHPSVIDFWTMHGIPQWHGYRFWMAHTPFPLSNSAYENPSILASADGFTWVTPEGLTNPLYPRPAFNWNADTDLSYDPVADQLVLVFIGYDWVTTLYEHYVARSSNGVTWPALATPLVDWDQPGEANVSPALVHMQDGTWAMFGNGASRTVRRWTAPAPEGPWSEPIVCTGLPATTWHLDVIRHNGVLMMIIDDGMEIGYDSNPQGIYAATSTDGGLSWTRNLTKIIDLGTAGAWDSFDLYRPTATPHENGTHMRVWYCGRKSTASIAESWHVGLTHVPLTEWPTP